MNGDIFPVDGTSDKGPTEELRDSLKYCIPTALVHFEPLRRVQLLCKKTTWPAPRCPLFGGSTVDQSCLAHGTINQTKI